MLIVGFFFFLENNAEDTVTIHITELWIKVQDIFYDYSRISSYSIVYSSDQALFLRLNLKKRGVWVANLRIDNKIASEIRPIISQYIEENPKEEITVLERITHFLQL